MSQANIASVRICLSSQILSCCQALYDEAIHVLYEENTISVHFIGPTRPGHELHVGVLNSLWSVLEGRVNCRLHPCLISRDAFKPDRYSLKDLGIVARFTNVHLSFVNDTSHLIASRMLSTFLRDKCVVIDLGEHLGFVRTYGRWTAGHRTSPTSLQLALLC